MRSARPKIRETNPHRQQNERRDYVFKPPPLIFLIAQPQGPGPPSLTMSTFERYLTVWVALCIVVGIALGHFFPAVFHTIG